MPIYEYQCQECDYLFEKIQKFSDEPVSSCPQCSHSVKRLMSTSSFILKGPGFYVNDYPSESRKNSSNNEKTKMKSDSKEDTKTKNNTQKKEATSKPAETAGTAKTITQST